MAEIVIDTALRHPPERVWRALTEPSALSAWFMATDFQAVPDAAFTLTPHGLDGFDGPITGQVRQVIEGRLLVVSWQEAEAQSSVTWEIVPAPEGCQLTMRQNGFFGVQGSRRRRRLRRTYALLLQTRLPAMLDRLAEDLTAPVPVWAGAAPGWPDAAELDAVPAVDPTTGGWSAHQEWAGPTEWAAGPPAAPAAPPEVARERRRYAVAGASVGAVLAVSATAGALYVASPDFLSNLGAAARTDRGAVVGSGGVGRAEVTDGRTALPSPAVSAPGTTPDPGVGSGGRPGATPPPGRPGGGGPPGKPGGGDPGGGNPGGGDGGAGEAAWTAAYRITGRKTEILVGNRSDDPARGWRVVVTFPAGVSVDDVRGADYTEDGNRVEFRARSGRAVPPGEVVSFRFKFRGREWDINSCAVNGVRCEVGDGGITVGRTRYAGENTRQPRGVTGFDFVRGDRGSEPRKPTSSRESVVGNL